MRATWGPGLVGPINVCAPLVLDVGGWCLAELGRISDVGGWCLAELGRISDVGGWCLSRSLSQLGRRGSAGECVTHAHFLRWHLDVELHLGQGQGQGQGQGEGEGER